MRSIERQPHWTIEAIRNATVVLSVALTVPAFSDTSIIAPDGRSMRLITRSVSVEGQSGLQSVSADVEVRPSAGGIGNTVRILVQGCTEEAQHFLTFPGAPPIKWSPGGNLGFDILGQSVCDAASNRLSPPSKRIDSAAFRIIPNSFNSVEFDGYPIYTASLETNQGTKRIAVFGCDPNSLTKHRRDFVITGSEGQILHWDLDGRAYVDVLAAQVCREAPISIARSGQSQDVSPIPAVPSVPQPAAPKTPASRSQTRSTGSGFIIGPHLVLTNHHVIDGCSAIIVRSDAGVFVASVVATTQRSDLAVIRVDGLVGTPASIRTSAMLGEDIVVAGHPLAGVLSSDLIVTGGQVNSLAGLGNDPNMLQISAPVQPGSSGGPLIDRSGGVVGIVVSKLNTERLAKVTGDIAQNVNFAIKPEVVRLFLDTNRISYRTSTPGKRLEGFAIAERARLFTVQLICN